jgi:hypothetical protein
MTKKKRPDVLTGHTTKFKTGCSSLFITHNNLDDELFELRLNLGKSGSCVRGMLELIGILYSTILQMDIDKVDKIKILKKHSQGISCGSPFTIGDKTYVSCLDLIAQETIKELENGNKDEK